MICDSMLLKAILGLETFYEQNIMFYLCGVRHTVEDHSASRERKPIAAGARCSLTVRWVVGSILRGVDPLSYFSFKPCLHHCCTKGRGMCYPVCGMMHIKEPLLLIGKSSLCGGSGFALSLSEWSFTI